MSGCYYDHENLRGNEYKIDEFNGFEQFEYGGAYMRRSEVLKLIKEKQREVAIEIAKYALKSLGIEEGRHTWTLSRQILGAMSAITK